MKTMKPKMTWLWHLSLGMLLIGSPAHADKEISIVLATLRGSINPGSSAYLKSSIEQAESQKAEALILELDTPGGLLSSVREMVQAIDESTLPVVVYVHPAGAAATSAGALLMLGSHLAAMAPGSNIGAAHPVGGGGEDIKGAMGEKALSDTMAFARGLADVRNRNRELADLIVSKSRSFTAQEALDKGLIDVLAPTLDELLRSLDGREIRIGSGATAKAIKIRTKGASILHHEMSLGQKILNLLANPNLSGILMTAGLLLLYLEFSHPGLVVPGVAGALCLLTAFIALQLLPVRTGALALVAVGVVMLSLEPFVVSYGSLALGGIISFVLGLIWLIDPGSSSLSVSPSVWIGAGLSLGAIVGAISIALSRMSRSLAETRARIGGGAISGLAGYTGHVETLEPNSDARKGKAMIRGEIWSFVSESPLHPGDAIEAVRIEGLYLHVRPKKSVS